MSDEEPPKISGEASPKGEASPNADDPQDGRKQYDCLSGYSPEISQEIKWEAVFLFVIFFLAGLSIFVTWLVWNYSLFHIGPLPRLKEFLYFASAGMLGGNVFGMKYFYRVVARGFWHQDRRYWRLMSPFIATAVSVIVGALIEANFVPVHKPMNGAACLSIGFLAGYFADEAVGKMYEIASVIFGKKQLGSE
ncbi:MAG: hypothetical protein ACRYFS_15270 [Janthinobacterium lividum]